jgi:beta-lactamase regulating signal transducer with metallopeptidase domain
MSPDSLPESLIGFALVFLLACGVLSSALTCGLALARPWLARLGPAAERRAAEIAASLPILLALVLVAVLVARAGLMPDHCTAHDHHAHLCLEHGSGWAELPWVVAFVALGTTMIVARLAMLGGVLLRGHVAVARLRRVSRPVSQPVSQPVGQIDEDVHMVESSRAFCFVAGLYRPAIYTSTAAWQGLAHDEREAMLAHERAHVRGRDLARRAALELLACFAAPFAPRFLRRSWERATERLRDTQAATAVGAPDAVARAIVRLSRLGAGRPVPGVAAFPADDGRALAERVQSLLAEQPAGEQAARTLGRAMTGTAVAIGLAAVALAEPLHHALETLLG